MTLQESPRLTLVERLVTIFLPVCVAVGGGVWAVWLFTAAQNEASKARLVEARKPFLEQQLALYFRASEVAGVLTVAPMDANWATQQNIFDELFHSKLRLVTDGEADNALKQFHQAVVEFRASPTNREKLASAAETMSAAFKKSIQTGWTSQ